MIKTDTYTKDLLAETFKKIFGDLFEDSEKGDQK